jgi:hypothetical protein
VPLQRRGATEEAAKKDGLTDFRFRDMNRTGIVPAGVRDEYFPAYYVSARKGNEMK